METSAPPINESVGLLAKYAPKSLERLRRTLPSELEPLLKPGGILGPSNPFLLARAEVCRTSLKQAELVCSSGINAAERRLKVSRHFRLAAEITASLTSAGVLASFYSETKLPGQMVALIGSLATVVSGFAARIPADGKTSLFETYAQLVEARFEAARFLQEIEIYLKVGVKDEYEAQLADLIGKGNLLCRKVNLLQTTLLDAASVEAASDRDVADSKT
jgi:hypothetical protein